MPATFLACPHCGNAIAIVSKAAAAHFSNHFDELERRLRALPAPFTSKAALTEATGAMGGSRYEAWRLWDEFRHFRGVRRVGPGLRWKLSPRKESS